MTILALDPDLFWAATVNSRCSYLLETIAEGMQNGTYQLALDSDKIEAEFAELYTRFVGNVEGNLRVITQIYGPVFKGFRGKVADLSSEPVNELLPKLEKTFEEFLADNNCYEPVEPELARMAYRGRLGRTHGDIVIVLVGDGVHCSETQLRSRSLTQAKIRNTLEKLLGIRVQGVTDLVPPVRDPLYKPDVEPSHYQSENFERAVRIKIHTMFDCKIVDSIPLDQLGLGKQEDIDAYLVKYTENYRKVWIGECRLYKEGNENEWVEGKKIQQLHERLPKVKQYEEKQPDCPNGVEVYGLVISNANFIDRDNWNWLVQEMYRFNIQIFFYQAVLKPGWSRPDGRLEIKELRLIETPFDGTFYPDLAEDI